MNKKAFIKSVRDWEVDAVASALAKEPALATYVDQINETPLLQVVKSKRLQLLKWLVDRGANINFQDQEGYSPLHYAVTKDYNRAQIQELASRRQAHSRGE